MICGLMGMKGKETLFDYFVIGSESPRTSKVDGFTTIVGGGPKISGNGQ